MLGGLARRVASVEKVQSEKKPVLVVDSGDLFFDARAAGDPKQLLTKARLIGQVYKRMGAAAINVGDQDLLQGVDFLKEESALGLPLLSANLLDSASRKLIFPPDLIREVSGMRIAFFGLLTPALMPSIQSAVGEKVFIKDPIEAARETLEKLRGRADVIVLLSDLGFEQDRALARAVPGIHFILGGHEGRYLVRPAQEGKTYIVQSYAKGMYLGNLHLLLQNPASPFLDKGKPDQIQQQIQQLDFHLASLQTNRERPGGQNMDRQIQQIQKQKAHLQEELRRSRDSLSKGNSFLWIVESLEKSLPENEEVRKWIAESGFDKD